jgi:serine/threonine protein kinase
MLLRPPQHGGRILGAGVYGCTFEPAPRCVGGSVFKTVQGVPAVGKLTRDAAADELVVGRKVMALPLAKNYFALPTEECKPELPVQDSDVSKCPLFTEKPPADAGPLTMFIMPMAGKTLYTTMHNRSWMSEHFIKLFSHILEGIVIYQRAGYVHNDLHTENILVDSAGVPRIIDFGQSFDLHNRPAWQDIAVSQRFKPKHAFPPEVLLWQMLSTGVHIRHGVNEIYEKNRLWLKLEHSFPSRNRLLRSFEQTIGEIPAIRSRTGQEYLQEFGRQFDAWYIGLDMWDAWSYLLLWPQISTTALWNERERIRRVIGGLTEFNPKKRLTPREALLILDPGNKIATAT